MLGGERFGQLFRGLDHCRSAPVRNVTRALPVPNGLHGNPGFAVHGGGAAERLDYLCCYGHMPVYPLIGYQKQGGYPKISSEPLIPSWQEPWVATKPILGGLTAFDRELVRATMKELGVTQVQLASEMGLHQSAITNVLKGERQVKVHEASYIYERLKLFRQPDVQQVPVIGLTSAGNWREAIESPDGTVPMPNGLASNRAFAVEVKGDSMEKLVQDGEYVVVDPEATQLYNDKVYLIQNADHETQIKLYRSNPARFEPMSDSGEHKTLFMGQDRVDVIGRIVWRGGPL
jgi:repressor LexA